MESECNLRGFAQQSSCYNMVSRMKQQEWKIRKGHEDLPTKLSFAPVSGVKLKDNDQET